MFRLCILFWIVQIAGMILTEDFLQKNLLDAMLFIKGNWFIRYIVVCYIIFYAIKQIVEYYKIDENQELALFCLTIVVWFVIDSIFIANPGMPFLAARQMPSFVFGMVMAKKKSLYEFIFSKKYVIILGGGIGILFMGLTQLHIIKTLPYLVSNAFALFTVFPLALAGIGIIKYFPILSTRRYLMFLGTVSYEIFLVHGQMENHIRDSSESAILVFIGTLMLSIILHKVIRKVLYYRKI